ncbi:MAG TPA: efflux RND transporter periplasmic adaptor subunit [Longimicrobiales bacterium]|nr:efflux RND transporter periplasmic adaptor subunit [Longimicrobiales bacterium]
MKLSRRVITVSAVLLVLSLAGAGVYYRITKQGEGSEAAAETPEGELPEVSAADAFSTDLAVAVEGAEVVLDTLVLTVSAPGEASSWQQTAVSSQVSGQVTGVRVSENQAMAKGAVLIQIDPTEYQLQLEEAQARLRQAEMTYRETTLSDDRIEDPRVRAERDTAARARSGLDAALVAVERAELNLLRTRIVAPFAGRVANLKVVPGQYVNVGDELLTVQAMDPIRVDAKVLEGNIGFLAVGRTARVTFSAFPGEVFEGRIDAINPVVDPEFRNARVSISVRNPGGRILPGMFARATLPAKRFPDRILVPNEAILERDTDRRTLVFVFQPESDGDDRGRAQWVYVTPGLSNDTHTELVEDPETNMLEPGQVVLVGGHYTLSHDIPVRLVENVAKAEGARPR